MLLGNVGCCSSRRVLRHVSARPPFDGTEANSEPRDALMAAQPMAGGYAAVEDQDEGFKLCHILVQARLIRKLRVPPS